MKKNERVVLKISKIFKLITTIILGFFSVFFAYLASFKKMEWGLKISFIAIFTFSSLRYNFGNDYKVYLNIFDTISRNNTVGFEFWFLQFYEPGWIFFNWFFRDLGFFTMNIFLALFSCIIYYRFIKNYVKKEYYWLALFIYIYYPGFLLIQSSAMRQAVAVSIFVYSIDYINKKSFVRYFITIAVAGMFHYSALLLLPVYFLVFFNKKIKILLGSILFLIYSSLFVFGEKLASLVQVLMLNVTDKYEVYQEGGVVDSGFGFIYFTLLFIIVLLYDSKQTKEVALLFKIAILSFFIIPLGLIIEMSGRFAMYLSPTTMLVYPNILASMNSLVKKHVFVLVLLFFTLYQFLMFFYSETYEKYFFEYHTIFSADRWY